VTVERCLLVRRDLPKPRVPSTASDSENALLSLSVATVSMRHQNGIRHVLEHVPACTTKYELTQSCVSVTPREYRPPALQHQLIGDTARPCRMTRFARSMQHKNRQLANFEGGLGATAK
jgi:hypothetical protein